MFRDLDAREVRLEVLERQGVGAVDVFDTSASWTRGDGVRTARVGRLSRRVALSSGQH